MLTVLQEVKSKNVPMFVFSVYNPPTSLAKRTFQFSYLPSCTTLAFIAIPRAMVLGFQTGRHGSARQEIRKLKNNLKGK